MGWRVAACWAVIGFSVQCFLTLVQGGSFADGMRAALIHYIVWGCLGYLVGTVTQRLVESSYENYIRGQVEAANRTLKDIEGEPSEQNAGQAEG